MSKHNRPGRMVIPIVLALGAFLLAAPSTDAAEVSGTGSGTFNVGESKRVLTVNVSAHTGPQGAYGSARLTADDPAARLDAHVDVDCVNGFQQSAGPVAAISGVVKKVTPSSNAWGIAVGDRILLFIADYGNPGDPMIDELGFFNREPLVCTDVGFVSGVPITSGNYTVNLAD